jgi:hypothetical protein
MCRFPAVFQPADQRLRAEHLAGELLLRYLGLLAQFPQHLAGNLSWALGLHR